MSQRQVFRGGRTSHLLEMPGDLIAHIGRMLGARDLCHFMDAIAGVSLNPFVKHHTQLVLPEARVHWLYNAITGNVCRRLHELADEALYAATRCSFVRVYMDWSPFVRTPKPRALAEYGWVVRRPHARVIVNQVAVREAVLLCVRARRGFGYVAGYENHVWAHGRTTMSVRPIFSTSIPVVPYFLISHGL